MTRELQLRITSGVAMILATLGAAYLGGWIFAALIVVVGSLATIELLRLLGVDWGSAAKIAFAVVVGGVPPLFVFLGFGSVVAILSLAAMFVVAPVAFKFASRRIVWLTAGSAYLVLGGSSLVWLRLGGDQGLTVLVWLFAVVWATDTGAFAVGKLVGGPKLAPSISPGKTISGTLGGLVIGGIAGLLVFVAVGRAVDAAALGAGIGVAFAAVIGDLVESGLKRGVGAKDSGTLIPGHGGVLDRIDSLLLAAPVLLGLMFMGAVWG